jgi:hypothetical protein
MKSWERYGFTQLILLSGIIACGLLTIPPSEYAQSQNETKSQTSGSNVVTGKLLDYYGPIVNAEVYLNSMKDEDCAKLFEKKMFEDWKNSKKDQKKLQACVKDVGPIEPKVDGTYTFSNLSPGYYALAVSWNTKEKFKKPILLFKKGDFVITYYEGAQYNAVSTSRPFYYSGTEIITKDFDFTKGVITNETSPH